MAEVQCKCLEGIASQIKHQGSASCSARSLKYFWEDVTREEANEKLVDSPDGSFLVRNSTTAGECTLVLRKNGSNKCIKILCDNGKYGFVEPCTYNSIDELVQDFSKTSLQLYNPALDIKLLYPICNHDEEVMLRNGISGIEKAIFFLIELNNHHLEILRKLQTDQNTCTYYNEEIKKSYLMIEALKQMKDMINTQKNLLKENQNFAKSADVEIMQSNYALLEKRYKMIEETIKEQKNQVELYSEKRHRLQVQICNEKLELKSSKIERDSMRRQVINLGMPVDYIEGLLEEEKDETLAHHDEQLWLMNNLCDRKQAESILGESQHGSFLVRPKTGCAKVQYVLSVKCNTRVEHCIIYFSEARRMYGFTTEFCLFKTLKELIIKYRRISLATHNKDIDVNLLYPVMSL